jgi:hypothetical protein
MAATPRRIVRRSQIFDEAVEPGCDELGLQPAVEGVPGERGISDHATSISD